MTYLGNHRRRINYTGPGCLSLLWLIASLSGLHIQRKMHALFKKIITHQHSVKQRQKCLPAVHFDLCLATVLEVILGNIHNATTLFQIGTHVYLQANVCVVASAIPLLKTDYVQEPGRKPTTETCLNKMMSTQL